MQYRYFVLYEVIVYLSLIFYIVYHSGLGRSSADLFLQKYLIVNALYAFNHFTPLSDGCSKRVHLSVFQMGPIGRFIYPCTSRSDHTCLKTQEDSSLFHLGGSDKAGCKRTVGSVHSWLTIEQTRLYLLCSEHQGNRSIDPMLIAMKSALSERRFKSCTPLY